MWGMHQVRGGGGARVQGGAQVTRVGFRWGGSEDGGKGTTRSADVRGESRVTRDQT